MSTIIQTHDDERIKVVTGDRVVNVYREYAVRYSNPKRWMTDPEAGLCIPRESVAEFIAALPTGSADPNG